jgi:hypothetical protein
MTPGGLPNGVGCFPVRSERYMAREKKPLSADVVDALAIVRQLCKGLDDCKETLSYGNPAFKRGGKNFVVLDQYKGRSCLWLLIDPLERGDRLAVDGWFASPYDPRETALCCGLDKLDWSSIGPLINTSYQLSSFHVA